MAYYPDDSRLSNKGGAVQGQAVRGSIWRSSALVVLVLVLAALLIPAGASAEIRTATAPDPADAIPTVSGVPNNPDISQVDVSYDSAGSITIKVSFYNAFNTLDTSENFGFWSSFSISEGQEQYGDNSHCSSTGTGTGSLTGQHHVYSPYGIIYSDQGSILGYSGKLNFTRTVSPDQKSVTITASSAALAGHNYRCLQYGTYASQRSTISNINSRYSSACDCWYVTELLDTIGASTVSYGSGVWFDGFRPPPPVVAPPSKAKSRIHARVSGGCHNVSLEDWTVKWPFAAGAGHPFNGKIEAKVGKRIKRFSPSRPQQVIWYHLRSGLHTIRVRYLGDEWRKPSPQKEYVAATQEWRCPK